MTDDCCCLITVPVPAAMATSIGISARLSRSSKKQELPYAFNSSSTALVSKLRQDGQLNTVENVMHAIEQVSTLLTSGFDGQIKDSILNMCQHLKVYGACLEILYKEQLDRAFVVFRNSSQDEDKLDYQSRLHLLELIELRANQWKGTDLMSQYYKKKSHSDTDVTTSDTVTPTMPMDSSVFLSPIAAPLLGPGEIMKCSGKFTKPTRIPGKNYCKDEVVIRNADSGKVMGIKGRRVHMIEELSETIISFQRVNPGAKERLVQITGASESSINHAKQLIEDTIRRNASPMREPNAGVGARAGSSSSINSSASDECAGAGVGGGGPMNSGRATLMHSLSVGDASVTEFMYSLHVKQHTLKITGTSLDLVRMSKLVLDEFFSGEPLNGTGDYYFETLPRSPNSPLEINDAETFDAVTNGQPDEQPQTPISTAPESTAVNYKPLRRPNLSGDEQQIAAANNNTNTTTSNSTTGSQDEELADAQIKEGGRLVYGMGYLARMSMSPLSVLPPAEWSRIANEHPYIVRKVVEIFDADQYLSSRDTVTHVLCTSASDESILSGSSV